MGDSLAYTAAMGYTAKKAYETAMKVRQQKIENTLIKITNAIRNAAEAGDVYIDWYEHIPDLIKDFLTAQGYEIQQCNYGNDIHLEISWRKKQ